jgi:hypothetical protein
MTHKNQPQRNNKHPQKDTQPDMKQQFLDASARYWQKHKNATIEERHMAEALEISVAEEEQQQMADSDYSHFYNLGYTLAQIESDYMRLQYKSWLDAWDLKEPTGGAPKKKFRYEDHV